MFSENLDGAFLSFTRKLALYIMGGFQNFTLQIYVTRYHMMLFQMIYHMNFLNSSKSTLITRKRFFTSVQSNMCLEIGFLSRSKWTVWTAIRFLASVWSDVMFHCRKFTSRVWTVGTLVGVGVLDDRCHSWSSCPGHQLVATEHHL